MKNILIWISVFLLSLVCSYAQVGVGTTSPDNSSILDITSTDKGVLVPRVNLIDVSNNIAPINTPAIGLLVWNTNTGVTGGNGIGFYFFNGAQWIPIQQIGSIDADFYEQGSTNPPDDINDNKYTFGNIAIGSNAPGFRLDVTENTAPITFYNRNGFNLGGPVTGIFNSVSGVLPSDADTQRGIYNLMSGSGDNLKYGVYNNMNDTGNSQRYGVYNTIMEDADKPQYGTYNTITSSPSTLTSTRFGTYNSINNTNDATNYGVYNQISGSSSSWQYGVYNWLINSNASNTRSLTGTFNNLQGTGSVTQYGMFNQFNSGDGTKYGVFNDLNFNGDGNRYGMRNDIGGTGNGIHYGLNNTMYGTGTGNKVGVNVNIQNTAGGTHYGIFSNVTKAGSFAGYYLGALSVGTTNADNYIFPASRGTANQIMQTDGTGNLSWVDATSVGSDDHDFYEEGTTTAPDDINDDQYTLGNLAIGKNTANYPMDIEAIGSRAVNTEMTFLDTSPHFSIVNTFTSNGSAGGSVVANEIAGTDGNELYGNYNYITNSGNGLQVGYYNRFLGNGSGDRYANYNLIEGTGSGVHYGTYNYNLSSGGGLHYGVYNALASTGGGPHTGTVNSITNSGSGYHLGIHNFLSGNGSGLHRGLFNELIGSGSGDQLAVSSVISNSGDALHYGIRNELSGSGAGAHYGNYNFLSGLGTGDQTAVYNDITNDGATNHYGLHNRFAGLSTEKYGVFNDFTPANTANRYGLYNTFDSTNSLSPTDYGVFTTMVGNSTSNQYGIYQAINSTGTGQHYGFYNTMNNGQGNQLGIYNEIYTATTVDGKGLHNQLYTDNSGTMIGNENDFFGVGSTHKGIENDFSGSISLTATGVENLFNNSFLGTGDNFGVISNFDNGSSGAQYGTYNNFTATLGNMYGVYNLGAGGTQEFNGVYNHVTGGSGNKYGVNNYFDPTAGGTHYGIYSNVLKTGSYAGYFLGNVSIGTTNGNAYILPPSRGVNGQVMQTDGSGNVNWVDTNTLNISHRINDLLDGKSDNDGTNNGSSIFLGINAGLNDDSSDNQNIGIGLSALLSNTFGYRNVAVGYANMVLNTTGSYNTSLGVSALNFNNAGSYNTAVGASAMTLNDNGMHNTAVGYSALYANNGVYNTAVGEGVLLFNDTGGFNTALGYQASYSNDDGVRNIALGVQSLYSNVSGVNNVAIGYQAGYNETGSNKLYIENSNSSSPLIYGEFDTDLLRINGTLDINNAYQFPTVDGTGNQFLQTNGTGNLSWVDDPSPSYWSRTGSVLNLANAGDDITFTNDQTSITFQASNGTPAPMFYMFSSGFSNADKMVLSHSATYPNYGLLYDDADEAFRFLSNGTEIMEIDLVGSPTVTITGNMFVNGDIITDTATYPDYVFESYFEGASNLNKDYTFTSLEDLEHYLKTKKHLPNVKSYDEVENDGMSISVGDMAITNLEKIEEAYLYIVELKKENDNLKEQLDAQQAEIDEIKRLLKSIKEN